MLDQNALKNHLYNTFVLPLMIKQNDRIHEKEVEVHHKNIMIKITIHKTDTVLPLEIILVMTKALLFHNTLVHAMTITKETRDLIALLKDLHPNHFIDVTPLTDIDHAHTLEIIVLQDRHPLLDHLPDQEILGILGLA